MTDIPLALVTGAAHRLGRVFAIELARQGYAILLHYHHSKEAARTTAEELRSHNVPVFPMEANLADHSTYDSIFSFLDNSPHRLRVLVNSAAIMPRRNIQSTSADDWDAILNVNLRAPFLLSQMAAGRMDTGSLIVNVTDIGARKLWTGYPAYVVSKSALETLTRLLAKEYAPRIRVNAIAPGLVLPSDGITPEEWEKLIQRLPLKHQADPADIASALEFLLRNESITGQTLVVDGGYSLI